VAHGTVATVSDPHEIANVLGEEGVLFMLEEARKTPFHFCFGAPSCVPATAFETAGAELDAAAVERLLQRFDIGYLSEMMNFPGVLHRDEQVMAKIAAAHALGKPVDGHAPGLRGDDALRYFETGISTDHECFTFEEALEKARLGVHILIREGSAARNFDALWPLLLEMPDRVMFCSDDKHPDDLIRGHINDLCARAVANGCDVFDVLRAACLHPVRHYNLPVGLLREGDRADFIRVDNLTQFDRPDVWIGGEQVAHRGKSLLPHQPSATPNCFKARLREPADFALPAQKPSGPVRVIQALDGQIVTGQGEALVHRQDGLLLPYPAQDVLKIVVLNRYEPMARPAIAFVRGFGMHRGALASSVAHDSHNIVAVGADDHALCAAINAVIENRGGISATDGQGDTRSLALPIAGLMSPTDGYELARTYAALDVWTRETLHCRLRAPFMVLSFLALPVIPALKMTDRGLFDVVRFAFTDVEAGEA
jgi:adenine deaminase